MTKIVCCNWILRRKCQKILDQFWQIFRLAGGSKSGGESERFRVKHWKFVILFHDIVLCCFSSNLHSISQVILKFDIMNSYWLLSKVTWVALQGALIAFSTSLTCPPFQSRSVLNNNTAPNLSKWLPLFKWGQHLGRNQSLGSPALCDSTYGWNPPNNVEKQESPCVCLVIPCVCLTSQPATTQIKAHEMRWNLEIKRHNKSHIISTTAFWPKTHLSS